MSLVIGHWFTAWRSISFGGQETRAAAGPDHLCMVG